MQKIKKALKSLAKLGSKKPVKKAAPAAKAAKKKVTSASIKKKPDVKAKTATKKAAAPAKKAATTAKASPKVAPKAALGKKAAPAATKKTAAPAKAAAPAKGAKTAASAKDLKGKKATPAPESKTAVAKPGAAKAAPAKDIKKKADGADVKPASAKATKDTKKKAKTPRGDEDDIPELDDDGGGDESIPDDIDGPLLNDGYEEHESDEVVLTDADGRRYCRVKECDQVSMVDGYCRYHYLLLWKKIQVRKKILSEGKLERYIEDLTARYPDKYLEMLRKDLRNEKDFSAAIHELEIDESSTENEFEDEAQSYIEEVRGMSGDTPARDDDGDF